MGISGVATVFAAVSAIAAAISARSSRQAVVRSHAPFVWPSIAIRGPVLGLHQVGVRLHNDGPGVAFNVRFSVANKQEGFGDIYAIPPIRAMRSGEKVPPHPEPEPQVQPMIRDDVYEYPLPGPLDQSWWVVVRYADGLGGSWEIRAPIDPQGTLRGPHRLRSGRLDRWRRAARW